MISGAGGGDAAAIVPGSFSGGGVRAALEALLDGNLAGEAGGLNLNGEEGFAGGGGQEKKRGNEGDQEEEEESERRDVKMARLEGEIERLRTDNLRWKQVCLQDCSIV